MMLKPPRQSASATGATGTATGTAIKSILVFWLFYFAIVTLRAFALGFEDMLAMAGRRAVVTAIGMSISWVLYLALAPLAGASVRKRAIMMFLACVPAAALFTTINFTAFYVYEPLPSVAGHGAFGDGRTFRSARPSLLPLRQAFSRQALSRLVRLPLAQRSVAETALRLPASLLMAQPRRSSQLLLWI